MNLDPTSIIEVARYTYKNQKHVENHCHNFHHLMYVTGGEGTLIIDGVRFNTLENDLYLIPPGIYHEFISDDVHPLCTLEVKFITKSCELSDWLGKLPIQFNNDNIGIQSMLERIVEEALNKQPLYKEIVTLHFLEMMMLVVRANLSTQPEQSELSDHVFFLSEDNYSQDLVNRILNYIHRHYTEQLTLTELANVFNINQAYICRIFTKKFDISPMQYVNNLKLQKVKKLLSSTDRSITEISEMVGFSSIHYLSRYFAARENMTPQEYRKNAKYAVHIEVEDKYKIVDFMINLK